MNLLFKNLITTWKCLALHRWMNRSLTHLGAGKCTDTCRETSRLRPKNPLFPWSHIATRSNKLCMEGGRFMFIFYFDMYCLYIGSLCWCSIYIIVCSTNLLKSAINLFCTGGSVVVWINQKIFIFTLMQRAPWRGTKVSPQPVVSRPAGCSSFDSASSSHQQCR